MAEAVEHIPKIISAAASSPLGILALLVLALSLLAYAFFAKEGRGTKLLVFLIGVCGVSAFAFAVLRAQDVGGRTSFGGSKEPPKIVADPRVPRPAPPSSSQETAAPLSATSQRRLTGTATFDYISNNGFYKIGAGAVLFETAWSKAGATSIHVYNHPPSIDSLALALGASEIQSINEVSSLDFSSRVRTPQEGEIVILKNNYGNYAALKIVDIKDRTRSDPVDEVTIEYVILSDGRTDFSGI